MQAVEFGAFVDNEIIEIPMIHRKGYSNNIRVILLKEGVNMNGNQPTPPQSGRGMVVLVRNLTQGLILF